MNIHCRSDAFSPVACRLLRRLSGAAQSLRDWRRLAGEMVDKEIVAAGVKNERVIKAMRDTPRHEFVPIGDRERAYLDMALPIGNSQTISPPFVVASMTEAIDPQPDDNVLEIGTGSGYQAAVLSPLVKDVYTIEIVEQLSTRATRALKQLGYKNVHTRAGDGYKGWSEVAPFDKIIVTCSPEEVPKPLVDQLKEGGLMVVPVGERYRQTLYLMRKTDGKLKSEALRATLFVPMTGEAESQRKVKPDPAKPQLFNGSFEENKANAEGDDEPTGWHYQRQLKVQSDSSAPDGKHFVTFENTDPGRGCHALQGFAVNGRAISSLDLHYWVRGKNIRPGAKPDDLPRIVVTFYDDRRATVGEESVGQFDGTFAWREETAPHPRSAESPRSHHPHRPPGAVGELSLDGLRLSPIARSN